MKNNLLLCLSLTSIASAYILVMLGTAVYHAVYPSVQTAFLANVHSVWSCWPGSRTLTLLCHQN